MWFTAVSLAGGNTDESSRVALSSGRVSLQHLNEFGESGHGYGGVLVNKKSKRVSARVENGSGLVGSGSVVSPVWLSCLGE